MSMNVQRGSVPASVIATVLLAIATVGLAALSIFLFLQYSEQKTDVDGKVNQAVADAKKDLQDQYDAQLVKELEKPYATYSGPDIMGSISVRYPKTWSVYSDDDGSTGKTLAVYFSPGKVPPVSSKASKYALRINVLDKKYEDVIADYNEQIEKGELKSSATKANGQDGTLMRGSFDKDLRGIAAYFQLREKTIEVRTDALLFENKFNEILKTLKFNI